MKRTKRSNHRSMNNPNELLLKIGGVAEELIVWNHTLASVEERIGNDLTGTRIIWALNWNLALNALRNWNIYSDRNNLVIWSVDLNFIRALDVDRHIVRLWDCAVHLNFIRGINRDVDCDIVWNIDLTRHWHIAMYNYFTRNRDRDIAGDRHFTNLVLGNGDWDINMNRDINVAMSCVRNRYVTNDSLSVDLWNFHIFNLVDVALLNLRNLNYLFNGLDDWNLADDFLNFQLGDILHTLLDLNLRDFDDAFNGLDLWNLDDALLVFDTGDLAHDFLDLHFRDVTDDLLCLDLGDFNNALDDLDLGNFDDLLLNDRHVTMHDAFLDDRFDSY